MITEKDLKQFVMLSYLSDDMLKKLLSITEILLFDKNEMVFRQGEKAERLYLLKKGLILLEHRISDKITIALSSIKPRYSFGWSAMLDEEYFSSDAICPEHCIVYSFKASWLKEIMEADHSLGFIISQRLLYVVKKRFDIRTDQFMKTIQLHPEISQLL